MMIVLFAEIENDTVFSRKIWLLSTVRFCLFLTNPLVFSKISSLHNSRTYRTRTRHHIDYSSEQDVRFCKELFFSAICTLFDFEGAFLTKHLVTTWRLDCFVSNFQADRTWKSIPENLNSSSILTFLKRSNCIFLGLINEILNFIICTISKFKRLKWKISFANRGLLPYYLPPFKIFSDMYSMNKVT